MANNNIWASYDSKQVEKILNAVDGNERKAYYETMGIKLDNIQTMESALKISGLDFEVEKRPLYYKTKGNFLTEMKDFVTTVRTDNLQPLGVVGPNYEILQNRDAFGFLDSLCMQGAKFETAGLLRKNGAASYVTMSTEPISILGDEFDPYMMIMNSFDGGNAVRICLTTIRAICRNTAIMAMKKAVNKFSIQHSKLMNVKLEQAKEVLLTNTHYLQELNRFAEEMAVKPFSKEAFEALCRKLYPISNEQTPLVQVRNLGRIEQLLKAYREDDLQNFNNSAWKAIMAVSDAESHPLKIKNTTKKSDSGTAEFRAVMMGMPILNQAIAMIQEAV